MQGLYEIKFHSANRNALSPEGQKTMARLFTEASADPTVKCVLLHGGKYYGSGNNIKVLIDWVTEGGEGMRNYATNGVGGSMVAFLKALKNCEKPVVAVVQGGAHGIHFTPLPLCDFVYCTKDAFFSTPFMNSFQSPEGMSTLSFP